MNPALQPATSGSIKSRAQKVSGGLAAHVVFEVDSQPYACPIARIDRLMRLADVQVRPSPNDGPPWEVGRLVSEGREGDLPVISLRRLWSLPDAAVSENDNRALLVVKVNGEGIALLVDVCSSVLSRLPDLSTWFQLPEALKIARGAALKAATPWNSSLLVLVELDELLPAPYTLQKQT